MSIFIVDENFFIFQVVNGLVVDIIYWVGIVQGIGRRFLSEMRKLYSVWLLLVREPKRRFSYFKLTDIEFSREENISIRKYFNKRIFPLLKFPQNTEVKVCETRRYNPPVQSPPTGEGIRSEG